MTAREIEELTRLIGSLDDKLTRDKEDTNKRLTAQDDQIKKITDSLEPITDNLRAGKLLYTVTIKILALMAAVGSAYIFIKQIMKDTV